MESFVSISLLSRRRKGPYLDLTNSFGRLEDTRGHLASTRLSIGHLRPLPYHYSRPFQTRASCHVSQAILGPVSSSNTVIFEGFSLDADLNCFFSRQYTIVMTCYSGRRRRNSCGFKFTVSAKAHSPQTPLLHDTARW
jgi:hypothetical protein